MAYVFNPSQHEVSNFETLKLTLKFYYDKRPFLRLLNHKFSLGDPCFVVHSKASGSGLLLLGNLTSIGMVTLIAKANMKGVSPIAIL